jgi:RimJ/RimL family protein N-acetyltransferase
MSSGEARVRLRPVGRNDLAMFRRFATEPGLIGLDWSGYKDPEAPVRRFATDGYLGAEDGRLIVEAEPEKAAAGFVSWQSASYGGAARHWVIGIALLPQWRGRGIGWRAQSLLCDYLFEHSPVQRIEAATHPENVAEQKSLEKVGFRREGIIRAAEFRGGQWHDGYLYGLLRYDERPHLGAPG